ncbi:hypothetical protein C8J57DRAFT_1623719 [Mycena rebaudengoi]|nr:hypothetical protein C8J57DRAFT_1623719 [Mycena rebaudengoi]
MSTVPVFHVSSPEAVAWVTWLAVLRSWYIQLCDEQLDARYYENPRACETGRFRAPTRRLSATVFLLRVPFRAVPWFSPPLECRRSGNVARAWGGGRASVALLRAPARLGGSAPANRVLDAFAESRIHLSQSDVSFLLPMSCRAMVLPVFRASSFGGCSPRLGWWSAGVALLRAYGIVQTPLRVGSGLASACAVSCQGSCLTPALCVAFRIVVCYSYCGKTQRGRVYLPGAPLPPIPPSSARAVRNGRAGVDPCLNLLPLAGMQGGLS